jgi:hypothetical protein
MRRMVAGKSVLKQRVGWRVERVRRTVDQMRKTDCSCLGELLTGLLEVLERMCEVGREFEADQ